MAYLVNRIDAFNFIEINGEPDESAQQVSIDSRPGVTGEEFTLEAVKGQVFSLGTLADTDDLLSAAVLIRAYKTLCAGDSVSITKNGELLVSRFKVLAVIPIRTVRISGAVGNKISGQAGAIVECRWDLIAVS